MFDSWIKLPKVVFKESKNMGYPVSYIEFCVIGTKLKE